MPDTPAFRHYIPMLVRFGDLDSLGHLNNAKYATYSEQARIQYVREVCQWDGTWANEGMILAKITMDFKIPIIYDDKVIIYTRCSRLGCKSFDIEHRITRQVGEGEPQLAATIQSVLVAFEYTHQTTIPVSQAWRERILAYEPTAPLV